MHILENHHIVFTQSEAKRFKLKAGVFLLLIQNNHLLLSRRYNTGIDDGMYVVPMGGLDGGETVTTALIREAQEEANIIIKPEWLQIGHIMHRLHTMPDGVYFEQMDIFFVAHQYEGTIINNEPHKCDELQFYPLANLPQKMVPFVKFALECVNAQQFFSEFGWK